MSFRVAFAFLALFLPAVPALAKSAPLPVAPHPAAPAFDALDRTIDPTARVGAITHDSTEADIVRIYGSTNVVLGKDGAYVVLFVGKPDELRVDFRLPHRNPERVSIGGAKGGWATASGLHVGLTVKELEELNGGPFDVTGLNYEIPARVVSWRGGAFPPTLFVDLAPEGEVADEVRKRLSSNKMFFDSSNPALKSFVVHRIVLEW